MAWIYFTFSSRWAEVDFFFGYREGAKSAKMKKYGTAMFNISGGVEGYDDEDHVCVCVAVVWPLHFVRGVEKLTSSGEEEC